MAYQKVKGIKELAAMGYATDARPGQHPDYSHPDPIVRLARFIKESGADMEQLRVLAQAVSGSPLTGSANEQKNVDAKGCEKLLTNWKIVELAEQLARRL